MLPTSPAGIGRHSAGGRNPGGGRVSGGVERHSADGMPGLDSGARPGLDQGSESRTGSPAGFQGA